MSPPPMARLNKQLGVCAHERHSHRHLCAVRKHEFGPVPELLDDAEDVVPPSGIEAARMVAKLVEDLFHLERGEDRLDEDSRSDGPARNTQTILGEVEDVVPEPRFQVALELGKIKVGPAALLEQSPRVVKKIDAEVEQAPRYRLPPHLDMSLLEVPTARADHQRRHLRIESILLTLWAREVQGPFDGVDQVDLSLDEVRPGRSVGVLEVRHEAAAPRVERVDQHLAVGGPRDLDPPVLEVLRPGSNSPFRLAYGLCGGQEIR